MRNQVRLNNRADFKCLPTDCVRFAARLRPRYAVEFRLSCLSPSYVASSSSVESILIPLKVDVQRVTQAESSIGKNRGFWLIKITGNRQSRPVKRCAPSNRAQACILCAAEREDDQVVRFAFHLDEEVTISQKC